ncbi:MAG: hypothetical protein GY856_25965, partial [bacterium]|nr:hypothetical protein [bacterium]
MVTYTYPEDPFGSIVKGTITELKVFGGDSQALNTNPAVSLCDLDLSAETPQYHQTFEYDPINGVMTSAQYVDGSGTPLGFRSSDLEIDPATGLIATSRTTDGLATNFDYDQLGRLTWIMPSAAHGGAWSEYRYLNATTIDPAKVKSFQRQNSSTTTLITEQEHRFDAIGRLETERKRLKNGAWTQRQTTYNGSGWRTAVSEWQNSSSKALAGTAFKDFDPFARPGTITPPDGISHDVELDYTGVRSTTKTVSIGS